MLTRPAAPPPPNTIPGRRAEQSSRPGDSLLILKRPLEVCVIEGKPGCSPGPIQTGKADLGGSNLHQGQLAPSRAAHLLPPPPPAPPAPKWRAPGSPSPAYTCGGCCRDAARDRYPALKLSPSLPTPRPALGNKNSCSLEWTTTTRRKPVGEATCAQTLIPSPVT